MDNDAKPTTTIIIMRNAGKKELYSADNNKIHIFIDAEEIL